MWKATKPLALTTFRVLQRNWKPCRTCQLNQLSKQYCTEGRKSWKLMGAVCLERYPVITQDLTPTEQKYQDFLDELELENSVLSDHEVQLIQDSARLARLQSADYNEEEDEDPSSVLTAADREDMATEELSQFTPASRVTEADQKNDTKSLERKLAEKLYLLVKCKVGSDSVWMMPQGQWQDGESMRQTAERVLSDYFGSSIKAKIFGNAPHGFHKYKFPNESSEKDFGAKVFFYRARLHAGDVALSGGTTEDHVWVTSQELQQYLAPKYNKSIEKFLLE
ncbi:large ribosomal subunit protein mL46-like [Glandiceps talaboti]